MLLQVQNITVQHGQLVALRDVSLSIARGEFVCVVGPNGAGKSTLLLTISAALRQKTGDILFNEVNLRGVSPEKVARMGISHVPEGRRIFREMTIEENLEVGSATRSDRREIGRDISELYELFPVLGERRKSMAGKLSGGEQQMLAIGRALMSKPTLLTIDEPSLGLAPKIVSQVYETLAKLRAARGVSLLVVEQSSRRALSAADRLYVLRNGQIRLEGKTSELAKGEEIHNAYFGFTS